MPSAISSRSQNCALCLVVHSLSQPNETCWPLGAEKDICHVPPPVRLVFQLVTGSSDSQNAGTLIAIGSTMQRTSALGRSNQAASDAQHKLGPLLRTSATHTCGIIRGCRWIAIRGGCCPAEDTSRLDRTCARPPRHARYRLVRSFLVGRLMHVCRRLDSGSEQWSLLTAILQYRQHHLGDWSLELECLNKELGVACNGLAWLVMAWSGLETAMSSLKSGV